MPLTKEQFTGIMNALKRQAVPKFNRRETKIDEKIVELEGLAQQITTAGGNARRFEKHVRNFRQKVQQAETLGAIDPDKAYKSLEKVKEQARKQVEAATTELHDTALLPETKTKIAGIDHDVQLHPQSMPGLDQLTPQRRKEVVAQVSRKIANGKNLFELVKSGDGLPAPSAQAISDLAWFIKTMAEEKQGEAFAKGAITIPDQGKRLRDFIDQCSEIYGRDSSHLKEQQGGEKAQARGIDYYEGNFDNMDLLLPYGMKTILTQSVATAGGEERLYMKMEDEGARFNPSFKKKDDTPESRATQDGDFRRSVLHLGNLLKAHQDGSLASFREQTPNAIAAAFVRCIAASKRDSPQVAEAMREGYKAAKKWNGKMQSDQGNSIRIHQITDNFDKVLALPNLSERTMEAIVQCLSEITAAFDPRELDSRFGGEVLLNDNDMTGNRGQPLEQDGEELDAESILDDADDVVYPNEAQDMWGAIQQGDLLELMTLLEHNYAAIGLSDWEKDTLLQALTFKRYDTPPPANARAKARREQLRQVAAETARGIEYREVARGLVRMI